ncbi:hypothetical protein CRYUN_Cryun06bG0100600 [Craigia yunnanensis]
MATISMLSNPNPAASLSSSFKTRSSSSLKCFVPFPATAGFNSKLVSSSSLSNNPFNFKGSLVIRCSLVDGNGSSVKRTTLHDLYKKEGQSPWYDNLCRPVTDLLPLIANGVRGVTSNLASGKDIESAYWELVVKDIQDARKLFEPIYDQTDGGDGYVSVEVSPRLADDTEAPCIPSIKEVIANGISVNVTLIFSLARYEAVIDAYLDGLEASRLSDLSRVTSVASFFVSRVDTLIDKMLEKIGTPEALDLRGKAMKAQGALAYQLYHKKFSGPRWEALVKKGAKKQRLLWASTSVKNPAYPDTLYVAPLIGPDTIMDTVSRTVDTNVSEAKGIYSALEKLGIDWGYVGHSSKMREWRLSRRALTAFLTPCKRRQTLLNCLMASISAAGSLPQSLTLSAGRASTGRRYGPIASLSMQQQQQQQQSQLIERRKVMVIAAVGLVAGALWDSSDKEIGMAMAASSGFTDMPALRGKDYGKTKMRFPDYTETESGLQYKDLRVGDGPTPKMGETVVVDWDGYTIGYYGRIFEARNKTKGGSFVGDDKDFFKFRLGSQEVIPAFEEAVLGMALGSVRRIIVPPELGYPENDFNKSGPRPTTFSGQRALDFVLRNQGLIDKTLLFDIELLKIITN